MTTTPPTATPSPWRWTTDDADIFRLAVPALGSLAAGPLYVLVDTAIVGHLGEGPLAGLGLAATVLDAALALTNFLAYATTAQVGRFAAAGEEEAARRVAGQCLWLAAVLGVVCMVLGWLFGRPALEFLGGQGTVADQAYTYLEVGVMGLPFALIATAGQGYLRGQRDMRTPLLFIVGGNLLNVVLELVFVYGFGWGLAGSAGATVLAQGAMGAGFIVRLLQAAGTLRPPAFAAMRPLLRASSHLFVRTAALYGSFLVVSSSLAHIGPASLAAHQVLFQAWMFLALTLDSIAIAGQVLVSRALGAGGAAAAVASARRMIGWSVLMGAAFGGAMLLLADPLPRLFTPEAAVLERVAAAWPVFALMQPVNGAVFALDGILIGAGDSRYLAWSMVAAAAVGVPLTVAAYVAGWGITGIWLALFGFILARLWVTWRRFANGAWVVTGA